MLCIVCITSSHINSSISLSLSLSETRERIDLGRGDAIPELKLPSWSSEAGRNLFCIRVQNSGMHCPTEYATSPSWVGSKLLCTIIYSKTQIPNSLLSHCHHIPSYFIYYFLFSFLCAIITSSQNKCISVFFVNVNCVCILIFVYSKNFFNYWLVGTSCQYYWLWY